MAINRKELWPTKEKLEDLYSSGLTIGEISKIVGFSHTWLVGRFKELGIQTRDKGWKQKGIPLTEEAKRKSSLGHNPNVEKLTKEFLEERYVNNNKTAQEIADEVGCAASCVFSYLKKYNISSRTIGESLSIRGSMLGEKNTMFGRRGKAAPAWQGGISTLQKTIRRSYKFVKWHRDVYKKNGKVCCMCGDSGGPFQIDHIKPFSVLIVENNLKDIEDANSCELLFDINNGRVMCIPCHKKTDTYGMGTKKMLKEIRSTI